MTCWIILALALRGFVQQVLGQAQGPADEVGGRE